MTCIASRNLFWGAIFGAWFIPDPGLSQASSQEEQETIVREIPPPAKGQVNLELALGGGFGSYTTQSGFERELGGLQLGVQALNDQIWSSGTVFLGGSFLIDSGNRQMVRKSLFIGTHVYLLGGKPRRYQRLSIADVASAWHAATALILRFGQDYYSATPKKVGLPELRGAVTNLAAGLRLTAYYGVTNGIGLDILTTLVPISSSIENETARMSEIALFWRKEF